MASDQDMERKQRYTDKPEYYCCDLLEATAEEPRCIQYENRLKEYTFADPDGFPLLHLKYCPWCAADISLLRGFWLEKYVDYVKRHKTVRYDEFDRFWPIISRNLSFEETVRLFTFLRIVGLCISHLVL